MARQQREEARLREAEAEDRPRAEDKRRKVEPGLSTEAQKG